MINQFWMKVSGFTLGLVLLGGCATGHIDPANRDTTGTYDGVWLAKVESPKAARVTMPGNFYMNCAWEPYEFKLAVKDGRLQMNGLEQESVVSTDGKFRFDWSSGSVSMRGGVMSGNDAEIVGIYTGNLSGDAPSGNFVQQIASLGGKACSANISITRQAG